MPPTSTTAAKWKSTTLHPLRPKVFLILVACLVTCIVFFIGRGGTPAATLFPLSSRMPQGQVSVASSSFDAQWYHFTAAPVVQNAHTGVAAPTKVQPKHWKKSNVPRPLPPPRNKNISSIIIDATPPPSAMLQTNETNENKTNTVTGREGLHIHIKHQKNKVLRCALDAEPNATFWNNDNSTTATATVEEHGALHLSSSLWEKLSASVLGTLFVALEPRDIPFIQGAGGLDDHSSTRQTSLSPSPVLRLKPGATLRINRVDMLLQSMTSVEPSAQQRRRESENHTVDETPRHSDHRIPILGVPATETPQMLHNVRRLIQSIAFPRRQISSSYTAAVGEQERMMNEGKSGEENATAGTAAAAFPVQEQRENRVEETTNPPPPQSHADNTLSNTQRENSSSNEDTASFTKSSKLILEEFVLVISNPCAAMVFPSERDLRMKAGVVTTHTTNDDVRLHGTRHEDHPGDDASATKVTPKTTPRMENLLSPTAPINTAQQKKISLLNTTNTTTTRWPGVVAPRLPGEEEVVDHPAIEHNIDRNNNKTKNDTANEGGNQHQQQGRGHEKEAEEFSTLPPPLMCWTPADVTRLIHTLLFAFDEEEEDVNHPNGGIDDDATSQARRRNQTRLRVENVSIFVGDGDLSDTLAGGLNKIILHHDPLPKEVLKKEVLLKDYQWLTKRDKRRYTIEGPEPKTKRLERSGNTNPSQASTDVPVASSSPYSSVVATPLNSWLLLSAADVWFPPGELWNMLRFMRNTSQPLSRAQMYHVQFENVTAPPYNVMLVAAETFRRVGLFDENFYPGIWEDMDMKERLRALRVPEERPYELEACHPTRSGDVATRYPCALNCVSMMNYILFRAKWRRGIRRGPYGEGGREWHRIPTSIDATNRALLQRIMNKTHPAVGTLCGCDSFGVSKPLALEQHDGADIVGEAASRVTTASSNKNDSSSTVVIPGKFLKWNRSRIDQWFNQERHQRLRPVEMLRALLFF